jgi:hypothetical protein
VGGIACGGRGDCAGSDAVKAMLAIVANRIGARRCMWLIGRAAEAEVTRRGECCCEQSTSNCVRVGLAEV